MLADRILDYLRSDRVREVPPDVADLALALIRRSFSRQFGPAQKQRARKPSASSSWYCARKMVYDALPDPAHEPEPIQPRGRMTFWNGDVLESTCIALMRLAGVPLLSPDPVTGEQQEFMLPVGGLSVPCHLDFTFEHEGREIPGDVKSMSGRSFDEFTRAASDPRAPWLIQNEYNYLAQIRLYMRAKDAPFGVFLAVNKDTGAMAELTVRRSAEFDAEIDRRADYVRAHITDRSAPPRPAFAVTEILPGANQRPDGTKGKVEEITDWKCRYCSHIKRCWEGFGMVPLASGPKWRRAV